MVSMVDWIILALVGTFVWASMVAACAFDRHQESAEEYRRGR